MTAGSIAAGFVGIGVAVAVVNVDANTEAFVDGGTLSAGRDVKVTADFGAQRADGNVRSALAVQLHRKRVRRRRRRCRDQRRRHRRRGFERRDRIHRRRGTHRRCGQRLGARRERPARQRPDGQLSAGVVAAGASIALGEANGSTVAYIGGAAQVGKAALTTVGSVSVVADADAIVDVNAVSLSAGFVGASANDADATIGGTVEASIKGSAQVETTGAITVEAISLGHTDADGTGVNVGLRASGCPSLLPRSHGVNAFAGGTANATPARP